MRIAVHSYVYYPESFLINELAAELVKRGHVVQAYTGLPNYPKGDFFNSYSLASGPYRESHEGVEIVRYPMTPRKRGFLKLALNYSTHVLGGLLSLFRLHRADVHLVFATSPITTAIPAIMKARLTGAKVFIWLQDLWPESVAAVGAVNKKNLAYRVIGVLVRWIYSNTDVILIQSPAFRANLHEFGFKGKVVDLPNWAPLEQNQNSGKEPEWLRDFPVGDLTITFAGNIGKAQGVSTILEAAAILKEKSGIKFVFVGDGSEKEAAQKFVADRKLDNVLFYGRRSVEDMNALFRKSTALIVSLTADPIFAMTIPSKVQAYLAAGRPILGSLNGVGADVIKQAGCGFVANAMDAQGLSEIVLKLQQCSKAETDQFAENARKFYEMHFAKNVVISNLERVLNNLDNASN